MLKETPTVHIGVGPVGRRPTSGVQAEILVDAREFWPRLQADLAAAETRIYIQALTFEGDEAGRQVASAVMRSGAPDRRVLIDDYTRHKISDRLIHTLASRLDRGFQAEVAATWKMAEDLRSAGSGVKFTNPAGPLLLRFPARNHKKLVVVDGVCYFGGINFSDHNFAWHDFMLRIDDQKIADRLALDFQQTWEGSNGRWSDSFDGLNFRSFDGLSNLQDFQVVFDALAAAREEILIESAYLTFPFFAHLRAAARRGARVSLIAPRRNNMPIMNAYVRWEARRSGIRLHLYPDRMIHLKALLIDGKELWIGSANFDFVSVRCEQELLCRVRDADLIRAFRERILDPDRARSPIHPEPGSPLTGMVCHFLLRLADVLIAGVEALVHRRIIRPSPERSEASVSGQFTGRETTP